MDMDTDSECFAPSREIHGDMEPNLAQTLETYVKGIHATLYDLNYSLTFKLTSTNIEIAKQASHINDTHSQIRGVDEEIRRIKEARAELNTKDLVVLQAEGQSEYTYPYRRFHSAPNFKFYLRTAFPIRKYETTAREGSTWKAIDCDSGVKIFKGEVRTHPFKDGYAKVVLYGYRREVSALDIAAFDGMLRDAQDRKRPISSQFKTAELELCRLERAKAEVLSELEYCTKDLQLLESLASRPLATPLSDKFLHNSVSGFVAGHGFASMVENSAFTASELTTWLFEAFEKELSSAVACLQELKQSYTDAPARLYGCSRVVNNELQKIASLPAPDITASLSSSIQKNRTSSVVQDCYRTATADLQDLNKGLQYVTSAISAAVTTTDPASSAPRVVPTASEWNLAVLDKRLNVTTQELLACKMSVAAIKEGRYVGVAVALRMAQTAAEAWKDIYRGVEVGMRVRSWTAFPPTSVTASRRAVRSKATGGGVVRKSLSEISISTMEAVVE